MGEEDERPQAGWPSVWELGLLEFCHQFMDLNDREERDTAWKAHGGMWFSLFLLFLSCLYLSLILSSSLLCIPKMNHNLGLVCAGVSHG